MKSSVLGIFTMSVVLSYSAPQRKCISRRPGLRSHTHMDADGRVVFRRLNIDNLNESKSPNKTHPRKRCCPYDFDSEKCQIVNDRKVCGYNMNSGGPEENPAEQTMNVGQGCWFRRGRLECGYKEGPYDGIRRPPVYDNNKATTGQGDPDTDNDDDYDNDDNNKTNNNRSKPEKLIKFSPNPNGVTTQKLPSCVEIRKKIVCNKL